jgi:hypothetical protein
MRRSAAFPLVIVVAGALAGLAGADSPPETVLPAPAVVTVGHGPTPWMRAQLRKVTGPLKPARRPRTLVIARLKLTSTPELVWFVTYRARGRALCGVMFDAGSGVSGLATGGLPCLGQCGALCMGGTTSDGQKWEAFVATVPVAADSLRATVSDGTKFRFPLTGPPVFGARDRRVVIGDLPTAQTLTLVEALQGETVLASQTLQPRQG